MIPAASLPSLSLLAPTAGTSIKHKRAFVPRVASPSIHAAFVAPKIRPIIAFAPNVVSHFTNINRQTRRAAGHGGDQHYSGAGKPWTTPWPPGTWLRYRASGKR